MTGVTLPVFKNIEHKTSNFVDDSISVVGAETKAELEQYVQHFYYLLVAYYKINKLKMNGDKSKMIMINDKDNPISISTVKSECISCDKQLLILGWWSNEKNTMDTHLMKLKSSIYHQVHLLKPAMKYMNIHQRKEIVSAKILSKLRYGLFFFIGQTEKIKAGVQAIIMYCYRIIYNENTFKMRNEKICKKIEMDTPQQLLLKSALIFIQKIYHDKIPFDLEILFRYSRLRRKENQIQLCYRPRTMKFRRVFINTAVDLLNSVDPNLRNFEPRKFKDVFKKYTINFDPG